MGALRKKFVWVLIFGVMFGVNWVGGSSSLAQQTPRTDKKYVLKVSHNQPVAAPQHQGLEEFKKLAEEWSKGRLQIQIYPAQQLGGLREQVEGVQAGAIEMSQQPPAAITNFAPQLGVIDTPFLFPTDITKLWRVFDSKEVLSDIYASLDKVGMKGFHFWGSGYKVLTANKPIHSPNDLKGLKYRVMPSPLLIAQFKAWGVSTVPIDYAETYNALQQKVVDGVEWTINGTVDWKLWEVQNFMSMTNHGYLAYLVIANKKWFESLPTDLQDIILRAEAEGVKKHRQLLTAVETENIVTIEKKMKVIHLTEQERAVFQKASESSWQAFSEKVGPDFFKRVQETVAQALK